MGCTYNLMYLDDAMTCLGEAMDYAENICNIKMDLFLDMFIAGGFAEQFEHGVPKVVSGISGTELVMEVTMKAGWTMEYPNIQIEYEYSPQYWSGWILAYYQYFSGRSFKEIKKYVSMNDIEGMYSTLHEAAEEKFVDVVNEIIIEKQETSKLQSQRRICAYSQRILAEKTGVNLRTLQQYESKAKNINKAAGETLKTLSNVLGCQIEDLLE